MLQGLVVFSLSYYGDNKNCKQNLNKLENTNY